ncbi:trypsin-like peptidase domain-containing protein [Corallococcus coralloides]|nr:trypsin-like peptidase domain-containing protein [Corallococcus coralloides]
MIGVGGEHCTGVVFGKKKILTAGHCIDASGAAPFVLLYPNQDRERLVETSVGIRRYDATTDIAVLVPRQELPFSDLKLACPPTGYVKVSIIGFPIGPDRGNAKMPRATPILSTATYVAGRYSIWNSMRDILLKMEFSPEIANTKPGSSGSPVLIQEGDGEYVLVGIYDGRLNPDNLYFATTAIPFLDDTETCSRGKEEEGSTPPSLFLSPGDCFKSNDGGIVLDGVCEKVATVKVVYAHAPEEFDLSLEVYDLKSKELITDLKYSMKSEPSRKAVLAVRKNKLNKPGDGLLFKARITSHATVQATLGPVRFEQPVTRVGKPTWAEGQIKIGLRLPTIKGRLNLALIESSTRKEVFRGNYSVAEEDSATVNFLIERKDLVAMPKGAMDLVVTFEDKSSLLFKDAVPSPCSSEPCQAPLVNKTGE